ncbi:hypothetical protein ACFV4F_18645 [Kitasatospora sp. NPDC059722]|uniref:hypothetical protein n=1 Tax=unclassified Kitasatospora TaxID=2633591 RepID=UPI0033FC57AF
MGSPIKGTDPSDETNRDAKASPRQLYSGGERPFDPEDLVMASGQDVTPERLAWARRQIDEKGAAALERYLP